MSFDLISPRDGTVIQSFIRGQYIDLPSTRFVYIPPLCMAMIPHNNIRIMHTPDDNGVISRAWLVRKPGVFASHSLFVDCGPVEDGLITTVVFNMSNKRILVRDGDEHSISRLVAL